MTCITPRQQSLYKPDRANDYFLLTPQPIPLEQIEIQWVAQCETLLIHGGIAQWAGIWAFALGGRRHQGRCWRISLNGDWQLCHPDEMPVFPWLTDYPEAAPWINSLLPELREQWNQGLNSSLILNHLIQACPLTAQLYRKYPVLMTDWCQQFGRDLPWWQLAREICFDPKVLLRHLGYFPDKQALKLYQRLDFSQSAERHRILNSIIAHNKTPDRELLHKLRHFPRLSIRGIQLLQDFPDYFSSPLASRLAAISDEEYHRYQSLITDSCRLFRGNRQSRDRLRHIRSFDQLQRLHDRLVEDNIRLGLPRYLSRLSQEHGRFPKRFAPQPLPNTEGITAITTPQALYQESAGMHHCVSIYAGHVIVGQSYYYHIDHQDEQATLELKKSYGFKDQHKVQRWTACELKGKYNKVVSAELRHKVLQWLEEHDVHSVA